MTTIFSSPALIPACREAEQNASPAAGQWRGGLLSSMLNLRVAGEGIMYGLRGERLVLTLRDTGFEPYDLDGPLQPEITWQPISFDRASQQGSYVMRLAPGG